MRLFAFLLCIFACRGKALEQYTPDKSDWSTFYDKALAGQNTDHSPDGVSWIDRDDWVEWDGTIYNATEYSKQEFHKLICPGSTVRGMYKLFYDNNPFADNLRPTKAEVDNWHAIVINHVRAMIGYTGEEYRIQPDKCLHLRALWSTERAYTRIWDTDKYPGTCQGSTNPHCGAGFVPTKEDQQPYLPDDIDYCVAKAGSEGIFSAAKSNIPWSIKWIRPFCSTLGAEGFWGGHTGPWFHRTLFGWDWYDADRDNFNSNAILRTKWGGPSGPSLYPNPDITSGRFLVKVEGVNPYHRFDGVECSGIIWTSGTNNATDCYYRMMEDDQCGKRFMTFNVGNFGCACYPKDMTTCTPKRVAMRRTWDFEPIKYSFDGLMVDVTKPLSNNQLPYKGRECPGILWKVAAGDTPHCLQKLMEGDYPECGRKFITWNSANGGCACYPHNQVTCTRAESIARSGRHTYELEVDPTYDTKAPTSPTSSPTNAPTNAPTNTQTEAPTNAPTNAPTVALNCQDGSGRFLFKLKKSKKPVTKPCSWLAAKKNKKTICTKNVQYVGKYVPAQELCKKTCKSCGDCYENPNSLFVFNINKKSGKLVLKNCGWLNIQKKKARYCKKKKLTGGGYGKPKDVCPLTCGNGC